MSKLYKIKEALEILEVDRNTLFYWIKSKRFTDPVERGRGKGARTRLSIFNLIELAIAKKLANLGVELNYIEDILRERNITTDSYSWEKKKLVKTKPKSFSKYIETCAFRESS